MHRVADADEADLEIGRQGQYIALRDGGLWNQQRKGEESATEHDDMVREIALWTSRLSRNR